MLNSFYMGYIWKLLENKDLIIWNYTDCKFICGVADEGIMKSDRLKLRLVIMRHSSLPLDVKYIEY